MHDLALEISDRWRVSVVCATPGFRTESGRRSKSDIIEVIRFPTPWRQGAGWASKSLNYFIAMLHAMIVALRMPRNAVAVIWSDPPFLDIIVGLICKFRGIAYIIHLQDWFFMGAVNFGLIRRSGLFFQFIRYAQQHSYRSAKLILCICNDSQELLSEHGLTNTAVLENWCAFADELLAHALPESMESLAQDSRVVIKYSGNTGMGCDLDAFEKMLNELQQRDQFLFIFQVRGRGVSRVRALSQQYPCVQIQPMADRNVLYQSLTACHAHLILTPVTAYGVVFPSKLYSILAAGMPVIASSPRNSVMHQKIKTLQVGLSAPAEEPALLARALEEFAVLARSRPNEFLAMRKRARHYSQHVWNARAGGDRFHELMKPFASSDD